MSGINDCDNKNLLKTMLSLYGKFSAIFLHSIGINDMLLNSFLFINCIIQIYFSYVFQENIITSSSLHNQNSNSQKNLQFKNKFIFRIIVSIINAFTTNYKKEKISVIRNTSGSQYNYIF